MQLKSCLFVAIAAGSTASLAMAQDGLQPVGVVRDGGRIMQVKVNGQIVPQTGTGGVDVPLVVYDSGPLAYYYGNPLGTWGENAVMTGGSGENGPVSLTELNRLYAFACNTGGYAGGTVDYVLDVYDTYTNPPAIATDPVNTVPLFQIVIGPAVIPAIPTVGNGYGYAAIDLSAAVPALVLPDNNFFYHGRWCLTGTTNPEYGLMPGLSGAACPTGNSDNTFMWDVNHDGIFVTGETYIFGAAPGQPLNLLLQLTGNWTGTAKPCCLPAGCEDINPAWCVARGGTVDNVNATCATANCTPPTTGACCLEDGTCQSLSGFACAAAGGLYRGDNQPCGTAATACSVFGFSETSDAGDTLGTAALVSGYGQTVRKIHGTLNGSSDADLYKFNICESGADTFSASTEGGTTIDTIMSLFNSAGAGIVYDDDTAANRQSLITNAFLPATHNGTYYLSVSEWTHYPTDASAQRIWNDTNPGAAFFPEWAPNGPATVGGTIPNPILGGWTGTSTATGPYAVTLTGSCFLGCYANCDQSATPPILNANDFQCFLNSFAGAQNGYGYANCDSSAAVPVLNANDFQCFLNAFAAGCPS